MNDYKGLARPDLCNIGCKFILPYSPSGFNLLAVSSLPPSPVAVGQRLALAIEALHLHRTEVARLCDVSPTRISQWAAGARLPPAAFLVAFCERYGITTDWILRGVVSEFSMPAAICLFNAGAISQAQLTDMARAAAARVVVLPELSVPAPALVVLAA
jgi:transcriptional regulator with XRE-family HTH domain